MSSADDVPIEESGSKSAAADSEPAEDTRGTSGSVEEDASNSEGSTEQNFDQESPPESKASPATSSEPDAKGTSESVNEVSDTSATTDAHSEDELTAALLQSLGAEKTPGEAAEKPDKSSGLEWDEVLDEFPSIETPRVTPEGIAAAREAGVDRAEEGAPGFYHREADAVADRDTSRAALMLLEASLAAERAGVEENKVVAILGAALELEGLATWLLPAARRLLMRLDRSERALQVCQTEVEVLYDQQRKVSVLLEAAALEHHVLGSRERGLAIVDRALDIDGRNVLALTRALHLHVEMANHPQIAATLEALSGSISTPSERALLLYSAGSIREAILEELDQAEQIYRQALEADPEHMPASLALSALQRRRSDWIGLVDLLGPLVELVPDPEGQARLLYESAAIQLDHGLDAEAASRNLRRAIETVPADESMLFRLIEAETLRDDVEGKIDALQRLLALQEDPLAKAELHSEIGLLYAELGEYDAAVDSHRAALEEVPLHVPAVNALRHLLTGLERFDELVVLTAEWANEHGLSDGETASRFLALAELNTALGQYDSAISAYRAAIAGGFHSPFWGMSRLLQGLERFEERADAIREHLDRTSDPRTQNHLRSELARLLAGPLEDIEAAADVLAEASPDYESRGMALERIELLLDSRRYEELAQALLKEADDTTDQAERHGWLLQAARVTSEALDDPDSAADTVRTVLSEAPGHELAVAELQRIARSRDLAAVLVEAHEHQLEHRSESANGLELYREIGEAQHNLGQLEKATDAFLAAQALAPAHPGIIASLESILRAQSRWDDVVEALELYAMASEGEAGASALCRAAELADRVIGDLPRAAELYRSATAMTESLAPRYAAVDVAIRQERWRAAKEMLIGLADDLETGEAHSRALISGARLHELWLENPPDLDALTTASHETQFEPQLRFEQTRARMVVGAPDLGPWLHELGGRTMDTQLAASWFLNSAHLHELADASPEDQEAKEAATEDKALAAADQAYLRLPDELAVIWCMERVLHRTGDHERLARIRERAAHLALDPDERVQTLSGAILPFLDGDLKPEGQRVAQECLNFSAHCLPALLALADLAESAEDWNALATHCDRLAEACQDDDNRFTYRLKAAKLWADQVEDSSRALASLNVALSHDPSYAPAFQMAQRLLRERAEFHELSRLFRRRINAVDDSKKVPLLLDHARLLHEELADPARASAELARLLAIAPGHIEALSLQANLLGEQNRWAEAVSALNTLSSVAIDEKVRYDALAREAAIHIEHLRQPRKGRDILQKLSDSYPDDLRASWQLVDLAIAAKDWDEARTLLEGIADRGSPEARVKAMVQLAEIARRGIWDVDDLEYESGALLGALPTPSALSTLVSQYRTRDEIPRLIEIAQALLNAGADPEEDRQLKELVADLLLEAGRNDEAVKWLGSVVKEDDDAVWARVARAQAMEKNNDYAEAARIYRSLLNDPNRRDTAYPGLIRSLDRLGRVDEANATAAVYDLLCGEELGLDEPMESVPSRALDLSDFPLDGEDSYRSIVDDLQEYLPELYPPRETRTLPPQHDLVKLARRLSEALGLGKVAVGIVSDGPYCVPSITSPAKLEVLRDFLDASVALQLWHIARGLVLAAGAGALVSQLSDVQLRTLVEALSEKRPSDPDAKALRKTLLKAMPRSERKQYKGGLDLGSWDWKAIRHAEHERADWLALLITRSPRIALAQAKADPGSPIIDKLLGDEYVNGLKKFWSKAQLAAS